MVKIETGVLTGFWGGAESGPWLSAGALDDWTATAQGDR